MVKLNSVPVSVPTNIPEAFDENFHRNFRTNSKCSLRSSPASLLYSKARGPFLERPGNCSGPEAEFEIKTCWIVTQLVAHKQANFASLTDNLIVSISKLLKLWS